MQVRKLLPSKEMRVDMKSLGMPQGCRVNGAVVSPGGGVVNWVRRGKDGGGTGGKLAKPKAKRMRLLEALESSSEEEAVPAAPMRVQTQG